MASFPAIPPGDLNPGIVRLVNLLRFLGYETCDSGDGATHEHACDRDHPYVVVRSTPATFVQDSQRLWDDLLFFFRNHPLPPGVLIQATYSPQDGVALVDLSGLADHHLPPESCQ